MRRPPDDDHLPDVWGLPAISLRPGELPEAGLRRIGSEKLHAGIEPVRMVGAMSADRGAFELILIEIEARIHSGVPDVAASRSESTRYVEQRWTDDLEVLREAARRGSLCCRIALADAGMQEDETR